MSSARVSKMPSFFSKKKDAKKATSTFFGGGKRAEKTEVLSEELQSVEQRVEQLQKVLHKCEVKLSDCLRTKPGQERTVEKRKKKLAEYSFAHFMHKDVKEMIQGRSLLRDVMCMYGEAYEGIVDELCLSEIEIEKKILERFSRYSEDEANIKQMKTKLKNLTLDMDSAKSRLNSYQERRDQEKLAQTQQEFEEAVQKVDTCKDQLATEMYILAAKEVEMASMFAVLAQIQLEYHRAASSVWDKILPQIRDQINSYSRRPVYGCPLADHLRFANRDIALVIEVCCSALVELGLDEEGIFRLSGVATKVKKIKASFDAGEIDLSDSDIDHHSITGALKSYLRELPDPLMTHNLYYEWKNAISCDGESRIGALQAVIKRLPKPYYDNLRYLIKFLSLVIAHSDRNKMTASNIAIVIGPNLIWSPVDDGSMVGAHIHTMLVECLVTNADVFFPGDVSFKSDLITSVTNRTGGFASSEPERNDRKSPFEQPPPSYSQVDGQNSPQQKGHQWAPPPPVSNSPVSSVNTLSRKPKPQAPMPPGGDGRLQMSQSMNGSLMYNDTRDDESDEETSKNSGDSRENSPDMSEKSRSAAVQIRSGLAAPKPATRRTIINPGVFTQDQKNSSVEELSSFGNDDGQWQAANMTTSLNSKGHRKTNSLDRPVKPPPAPPSFVESQQSFRMPSETITSLPEEPSSTAADPQSKGGVVHPVRPPLPTKENLERNSAMRNSIGKGDNNLKDQSTTGEPVKSARHTGKKVAPKADISEADSTENLYDEVMPDAAEKPSPPQVLAVRTELNLSKGAVEVVNRRSAPEEQKEGEEVVSVKNRKSMFEAPKTSSGPVSAKPSTISAEMISPTSPSPVPHILTVNTGGAAVENISAPPPRPKPPVPTKPKVEGSLDADMTRF